MKISKDGLIEIEANDIQLFKDFVKNPQADIFMKDKPLNKPEIYTFKRHLLRHGVDEYGIQFGLSDHHIISRAHIKSWLIKLVNSSDDNEIKDIIVTYLNDPRNEQLRESVNYEYSKVKNPRVYKIIYFAFIFNPKNLVVGPETVMRINDPGSSLDLEILSQNDSTIIAQLQNAELSMCEKISMLANKEKRGVTTWIRDANKQNGYVFKEDMDRIGQNVCQWYVKGFDKPEHPEKCINLSDGTLVKCTRKFFKETMAPIQSFFYSLKSKVFS